MSRWWYALLCLGLASCKPSVPPSSANPPPPTPGPSFPVGVFLPLSGSQSAFGLATLTGIELAVGEINDAGGLLGKTLRLVVRDTRSESGESARALREMVAAEGIVAAIGEVASERSLEAAPVAVELKVPMISPGSTHAAVTQAGPWVFRVCYVDPFPGRVMSKFASSIGVARAAIFSEAGDPYSTELARSFQEDFIARGGVVAMALTYNPNTRDFSEPLKAIKASAPEVVFLPAYFTDAAEIIKQARPLGLDTPFIGTDGWESEEFLRIGGEAVNNCYFASHFSAEKTDAPTKAFVAAYNAKFHSQPAALAALGFDAVKFLAHGLTTAGTSDAEPLRAALAATQQLEGVTGDISLDAERNPTKSAIVLRVEDAKFSYLETVNP